MYWKLEGDLESKGQASLGESQAYHQLEAVFSISESDCLDLTHVCVVDSPNVKQNFPFLLNENMCVRVVDGYSNFLYSTVPKEDTPCWNAVDGGSYCISKNQEPLVYDNAVIRFCQYDAIIRPLDISWEPRFSQKLYTERSSKLLVGFTIANVWESIRSQQSTFSVQIFFTDVAQTQFDLVSDVTNPFVTSDSTVLQISSEVFENELEVGDSLRFDSVSVTIPSFSSSICSAITHVGIAAFDLENYDTGVITWAAVDQDKLECTCNEIDLSFTKFYLNQYLIYYDADKWIPFYGLIQYHLKGDRQDFFEKNSVEDLIKVELYPPQDHDHSVALDASFVSTERIKFFDQRMSENVDSSDCTLTTGYLYIQGKLKAHSHGNAPMFGKYTIQASINEDHASIEVNMINNKAYNELVFLEKKDELQFVSASGVFSLEDNGVLVVDTYLSVQYSAADPIPLFAGDDFLEIEAFFGDVDVSNAFTHPASSNSLKLKQDSECDTPRTDRNRATYVLPGELMELHHRFYAVSNDIAELYCSGFDKFIVTVQASSLYDIQEVVTENNAVEIAVPNDVVKCQDLLQIEKRRLREIYVVPVALSIDVPQFSSYIVADGVHRNEFVVALKAIVANQVNHELLLLYLQNLVSWNTLTVHASLTLVQHHCNKKPCPTVELTRLSYDFDATELLHSKFGLDKTTSFQLSVPSNSICGWSELSWKFELELTNQRVIAMEEFNDACPTKPYKIFVMCEGSALSLTSYSQNFPPFSLAPAESQKSDSDTTSIRVHFFKISAFAFGTGGLSLTSEYKISLCSSLTCDKVTNFDEIQVTLVEYAVAKDSYPSTSSNTSSLPGQSELIEIEGKLKVDYTNYARSSLPRFIEVSVFVQKSSSDLKFFGNLTLNPSTFYDTASSSSHGFTVSSFSFFAGSTIKRTFSGRNC